MIDKLAALLPDVQLQPHQEKVKKKFQEDPNARMLLMHQLGSGKSLSSISAAEGSGEPYSMVAPASLRETLRGERKKFTDEQTPADLLSYTQIARKHPVEKLHTLIFDEAHNLRNPDSQRSQRAMELANKAKRLILLSGSPLVNAPSDLAVPMSMLTKQEITPAEFEAKYVGEKKVWPGLLGWLKGVPTATEPTINNEEELRNLLKGHVDYYAPDKPVVPVNRKDITVQMGREQSRIYRAMWNELPWLLKWKLKHDYPLTDEELHKATSFLTGPRQVGLSTYPYLRNKDPYKAFQHSTKLNKAFELMQEKLKDPRTKGLVFSNFIDAGLRPYSAALEKAKIPHGIFHGGLSDQERKKLVEDYNSNKLRVALLGPSGAEGLSFKGTQLLQQLDPHFNAVRPRQSEGRGVRFDSHTHLPEELQNVEVQRFISRLPPGFKERLLWWVGHRDPNQGKAVDEHLLAMAERKDKLNQVFTDLLKQVGSSKEAMDARGGPSSASMRSVGCSDEMALSISADNSELSSLGKLTSTLQKIAEEKVENSLHPALFSAGIPAAATVMGAMGATDTGSPVQDRLRGGLKGLGTGTGAVLSALLARALGGEAPTQLLSGAAGGGLGYYLTHKSLEDHLGSGQPGRSRLADDDREDILEKMDQQRSSIIRRPQPIFNKRWQQVRPIQAVPY